MIDTQKALLDKMNISIVLMTHQSQRLKRSMKEASIARSEENSSDVGQNRMDGEQKQKEHTIGATWRNVGGSGRALSKGVHIGTNLNLRPLYGRGLDAVNLSDFDDDFLDADGEDRHDTKAQDVGV